jgi:hypothetical protein
MRSEKSSTLFTRGTLVLRALGSLQGQIESSIHLSITDDGVLEGKEAGQFLGDIFLSLGRFRTVTHRWQVIIFAD